MRAVHSRDTKPELLVRRALFRAGIRYRLQVRALSGTPDIFVLKYGVAVFVNGCFWHRHGCRLASAPKTHTEFWAEKFSRNLARDVLTLQRLSQGGYRVAVIWECSIREDLSKTIELLLEFIRGDEEFVEI